MTSVSTELDRAIVDRRMAALDAKEGPRVGDFVRFSDGVLRRISYHWTDNAGWDGGVQTSDGGSFYLGDYGCSFSGSLHPAIPNESLELTDEQRDGLIWIFHRDTPGDGRGVGFRVPFRVYTVNRESQIQRLAAQSDPRGERDR